MTATAHSPSAAPANPIAAEATRGGIVESLHRAAAAVCDAEGRVAHSWGDVARPVFPRSAIKAIQALPIIETGAADRFALTDAELALACASHGGEPMHVSAVEAWLARIGLSGDDLECGPHAPIYAPAAEALFRAGESPRAVHNNCSGKHAGMLTTARHMGEPIRGYIAPDHPVQRRVAAAIGAMCGVNADAAPLGVDGCSIPTFAIPLTALATGMARIADPSGLSETRREAVLRLRRAVAAHPEMVAGTGRFCTALNRESEGRVFAKTGAEGVYCAAVPALGLGVAVKADDGAARAAQVATLAVLARIGALDDALAAKLADHVVAPIVNRAGRRTGEVRAARDWPPAGG